jgi:adenosylcobinamide-GDP ribazoletransferase
VDRAASGQSEPGAGRAALPDAVRLALGTLTALPVPPPRRVDPPVAAAAMLLAPLAGLIPGLAAGALAWLLLRLGGGPLLAAAVAIGTAALITRGLHLDGLADTADGLAAGYRRDRALAVMRSGDSGPAGVATLALVLLVQVAALAQALSAGRIGPAAAVIGIVAGRAALPLACARGVPSARPEGLGAAVAGTVPRRGVVLVGLVVTAAAALVTDLPAVRPGAAAVGWLPGAVAVAAGLVGAGLLVGRAVRRLGGITGDVLGAAVEVATTTARVVLAMRF